MQLDPGLRVADRYVVERPLAQGGMGAVYLAFDERLHARVALKVTVAAGLGATAVRERFSREARIGHQLGRASPRFVRALDWGKIDDVKLYLALDLVENALPLDIRRGSRVERLRLWSEAAQLVLLAHEHRVIHRDLKPNNFLHESGGSGRVFLTDFGLAKVLGADESEASLVHPPLTLTGDGFGTPAYMAPEQFEDSKNVDERADVFALGCMLFEALTGRLPFPGNTAHEIWRAQQRVQLGAAPRPRPAALDPTIPAHIDEACALALALDRSLRTASVAVLLGGLSEPPRDGSEHHEGPASVGRLITSTAGASPPDSIGGLATGELRLQPEPTPRGKKKVVKERRARANAPAKAAREPEALRDDVRVFLERITTEPSPHGMDVPRLRDLKELHWRSRGPRLPQTVLDAATLRIGAPLPDTYREFLAQVDGGRIENGYLRCGEDVLRVCGFYPFADAAGLADRLRRKKAIPPQFLPIAYGESVDCPVAYMHMQRTGRIFVKPSLKTNWDDRSAVHEISSAFSGFVNLLSSERSQADARGRPFAQPPTHRDLPPKPSMPW